MKKINLASALMVLCAIVVIAFQLYWINSLYKNEKNIIAKTTNALFKETVYEIQDKQTLKDTAFITHAINDLQNIKLLGDDATKLAAEFWHQIKLSFKVIDEKQKYENNKVIEGLASTFNKTIKSKIDSTREVIKTSLLSIDDINGLFKNKLSDSENDIDLPFEIFSSLKADSLNNISLKSKKIYSDVVSTSTNNKSYYCVAISGYKEHILKKILPQIIFSIFIIVFFIASIIFAYKTLNNQKQLVIAKNEFIGNITHEFKTPITTISVALEAITKFGVINDKELTIDYLKVSSKELNRLNLLVDKVLKLSLFENGKTELKTETINLNLLIADVLTNMKPQFDKYNANVIFNEPFNIDINADKSHIKSVVYNLVDNAIKYCDKQPNIIIDLVLNNNIIEIIVQDNGIGIANQHLTKIFDKFYRVPQGNTHNAKGYGLGLSYISHIVKMHNGYITVNSILGKGSKFIVGLTCVSKNK